MDKRKSGKSSKPQERKIKKIVKKEGKQEERREKRDEKGTRQIKGTDYLGRSTFTSKESLEKVKKVEDEA